MIASLLLVMTLHLAGARYELTDDIVMSLEQEVYENTLGNN